MKNTKMEISPAELLDVQDIFENDEYVLMKAIYKTKNGEEFKISIGIKSPSGDIFKIVDLDEKYFNLEMF